jgi:hypothetical protein
MGAQGLGRALLAVVALLVVAGCGDGNVGESGSVASPTVPSDAPVIVTFEVNEGDRFMVLLTEPDDIDGALRLLAGEDAPDIPNGRIVRETGVNEGWSWSLDPADFEFADVTIEVCDGAPADVESGALTGDRYCPWSARVVAVDPAT